MLTDLWLPQKGEAGLLMPISQRHTDPQGLPGVVAGLQVSHPLPSTFAHLPSSSGADSCRGQSGLRPGGGPAAPGPGPRCGSLGWRPCGRDGRSPAAVSRQQSSCAPRHSPSASPPCPLSFPKGSEGTRDHSTWSVPVGGTSAPTSNPRKHSQLGLNVAAGTWMSQAGSLSQ